MLFCSGVAKDLLIPAHPAHGADPVVLTCCAGSVAGALAVAGVGSLYKATGSWDVALVGPMIGLYVLGAAAWTTMVVNTPLQLY